MTTATTTTSNPGTTLNQAKAIYWTGGSNRNELVTYVKWESLTPQREIQVKLVDSYNGRLIWVRLAQLQN